jgi:hypothetical protein
MKSCLFERNGQNLSSKRRIMFQRFVPFALIFVLITSCGTPAQVPVNATLAPTEPTAQEQVPSPTSTPAPTMIPPTSTPDFPTATPTASLPEVEIINDLCYGYKAEGGSIFQIAGEVRNNTNIPMGAWINATVYDGNQQVIATIMISTELNVIPPGGKSPFEDDRDTVEWPGAATCSLQVQGFPVDFPTQALKILSQDGYSDDTGLHITGVVENTGTTPAEKVWVVATLYDSNGKVIAVDVTPSTLQTIPAGGTSTFAFYPMRWSRSDHYELQVAGQEVGNP